MCTITGTSIALIWKCLELWESCLFLQQYYAELGLQNNSDEGSVRDAFIKQAKKFHPDSGHPQADAASFQLVRPL